MNLKIMKMNVFMIYPQEWAKHTGRYREGVDERDYATWKTRLRCAFNKAPDIQEVKDMTNLDAVQPFRVYRLLPKKRKLVIFFLAKSCSINYMLRNSVKHTSQLDFLYVLLLASKRLPGLDSTPAESPVHIKEEPLDMTYVQEVMKLNLFVLFVKEKG